jgi:hypothetical protein
LGSFSSRNLLLCFEKAADREPAGKLDLQAAVIQQYKMCACFVGRCSHQRYGGVRSSLIRPRDAHLFSHVGNCFGFPKWPAESTWQPASCAHLMHRFRFPKLTSAFSVLLFVVRRGGPEHLGCSRILKFGEVDPRCRTICGPASVDGCTESGSFIVFLSICWISACVFSVCCFCASVFAFSVLPPSSIRICMERNLFEWLQACGMFA